MSTLYISTLSATELFNIRSANKRFEYIGYILDGQVEKPTICKNCGGYTFNIKDKQGYLIACQCIECNEVLPIYYSTKLSYNKPWFIGGVNWKSNY